MVKMILLLRMTYFVANEKLKLENHFFEMVTATVSHDMKTPINAISGMVQNLDIFIPDQRGKIIIEIINDSTQHLLSLVNDFLDFFHMKNNTFRVFKSPTSIRKVVQSLFKTFRVQAREKGLKLSFHIDDNVPEILVLDGQRIK